MYARIERVGYESMSDQTRKNVNLPKQKERKEDEEIEVES